MSVKFKCKCNTYAVQAQRDPVVTSAEGTGDSSSVEEQARASAPSGEAVREGRRTIRLRGTSARRRSLSCDVDRRMKPKARLPAGRSASLGRTPERSLARRRLARRSCISSVVAVRADVRRLRQRRLAPTNPLARTEEVADEKLVSKHMAELMKARSESKPKSPDGASTRCAAWVICVHQASARGCCKYACNSQLLTCQVICCTSHLEATYEYYCTLS